MWAVLMPPTALSLDAIAAADIERDRQDRVILPILEMVVQRRVSRQARLRCTSASLAVMALVERT